MSKPNLIKRRSPFNEGMDYRLVEWAEDYARVELDVEHRHLNSRVNAHGGVLMSVIDAAGGYCGTYCAHPGRTRICVTASLTTEFVSPAQLGDRLVAVARRRGGGRGIFTATVEVHDQDGRLIALGHGVYRYIKGSGAPEGIPGRDSTEDGEGPADG